MDGSKDYLESEIVQTGKCLTELVRKNLCPDFVRDEESILPAAPWDEEDCRVGIYLYDIQDYSLCETRGTVINDGERRFPPKAVELSYMIFCNERHRFGGVQREMLHAALNEVVRAVYDNPVLEREDHEEIELSFLRESVEFKIRLWGSFSRPLQPAVYIRAVPVLITSRRRQSISSVKERDYQMRRKAE